MCSCFDVNMVAEHIMNVLVPLIMEEFVEVVKVVLRERISERVREKIVDVHVPRAVEQVTEVAKTKEISVLAKTIEEQMVRVETLAVEVEKMRSELFEAERALLANPFAKVKGLITCLINKLQTEAPSEMSHTSYRDGETSMATEKEDLEVDITKHSSELEVLKITKPRPNLAACGGSYSRCSCAGEGETVSGSAEDRIPGQNRAADCGTDR